MINAIVGNSVGWDVKPQTVEENVIRLSMEKSIISTQHLNKKCTLSLVIQVRAEKTIILGHK